MILDEQTLFSDQQAITATAASENVVDLGVAKDLGPGTPIPILIQVTEDFDNLTTLQFDLEVDDADTFGSPVVVQSAVIALADLVAGKQVPPMYVPLGVDEQFARLYYTVVGTAPSVGKVTAGLSMGNQTNVHG